MRREGKAWIAAFTVLGIGIGTFIWDLAHGLYDYAAITVGLCAVCIWIVVRCERYNARCDYCDDERVMLRYGAGPRAELIACPVCRDGEHLAETTIPTVTGANGE